ncbi:MAG TPA: malto-oligosyltrehalose synthase [Candidatus Dormibacteraeota bacterium]|nr:malto-oligosyltrehalose synthase [Candidatus Dormibacteraeota bacterium]
MNPRCTYRIQLSSAFTFDDAAACAAYFASLGISHLYCSPILQAVHGSTHGYDVVDPTRVSDDLGGDAGFHRLVESMRQHSIELIVDIVPNHMATAGRSNPWWWDLLSNGLLSPYAGYFDVDWAPSTSTMKGRVLLGVLGDRYGRELERGALTLEKDGDAAVVRYHDQDFPISRDSLDSTKLEEVERDLDAFDSLLQHQNYRLAYWRSAQEELNYRRFFTIDSLIGLRVEREEVFEAAHRLVCSLVASGDIDGLRVDHIDGLRDPQAYLERLRSGAPDAYVVAEKILAADEWLPSAFPLQGTTGYDFIAEVDQLFVDHEAEAAMTALYHAFTGDTQPYPEVVHSCKQEIVTGELAADIERLTSLLVEITDGNRNHRDRSRRELVEAVREVAIGFRVYRTYATPNAVSDQDRREVESAVNEAARRRPDIDVDLLNFVRELLCMQHPGSLEAEFVARFQQLTPAIMAKGVEDTAFYRYNRLISLNEVGGDPGRFGESVDGFHEWCARMAATWPGTMLTLSTHDTKRSGDVRARLNLLSELPSEWEGAVRRWSEHNDRYRPHGYPDRNLEYLAYQTLVGAWPIDVTRLTDFLVKAAREAKLHTSWTSPNQAYEDSAMHFAAQITADAEFMGDLEAFIGRNQLVALGRLSSLAQTTLMLLCPGVPDIYQGTELWNLALVDPDNRRPVAFDMRARMLSEIRDLDAEAALARVDEGATKLWLISRLLPHRPQRVTYTPVPVTGSKARHAVAFQRERLFVLVPRLVLKLGGDWADTEVALPQGRWTNVLTGEAVDGGTIAVVDAVKRFPIVVLERAPN